MESQFFTSFLMISDWRTVLFLAVLAVLFGLIHYLYHKCKMGFSLVVCVGMVAGALLGLVMQLMAGFPDDPTKVVFIKETTNWFQLFGNGYIDLIKMIVIPLVIISIAHVVINMDSGKTMSRLVKRTLLVTLVMTAIAAVIGIVFGILFDVGSGSAISSEAAKAKPKDVVSVASTLRALIPGNLVDSMVKNNVIGMVIFGAVFGRAIWWIKADKPDMEAFLHKLIDGLHKTMMNMALLILAFTSRSSAGCLPVTIETLVTRLGVNQGTASFVAGFGTTAGMQGCAGVFPAMLIVYVCHLTGTPLDITMLVMTVIVVTIGSLGIAGIPGTATMAASVSLSGVGMASSFSLIGPILAIDPLIDMMRTMVNVSGSVTNSIMIDKQLGTLDMTKYNSH